MRIYSNLFNFTNIECLTYSGTDLVTVALMNKTNKNPCSCSLYSCEGRMKIKDMESSVLKGEKSEQVKGDGGVQL